MEKNEKALTAEEKKNLELVTEIEKIASDMHKVKDSLNLQDFHPALAEFENEIIAKLLELKKMDKAFVAGSLLDSSFDYMGLLEAERYALVAYGRTGLLIQDENNEKKAYYVFADAENAATIPFMYLFNVAFAKKRIDYLNEKLNEADGENRKAKALVVRKAIRSIAKAKGLVLKRITCNVLSRKAVDKLLNGLNFTEAEIQAVHVVMDENLVCSNEARCEENGANTLDAVSSYADFCSQEKLNDQWCALFDTKAQAEVEEDKVIGRYVDFLATYNFFLEGRAKELQSSVEKLIDSKFMGFLTAKADFDYGMKLEDAIVSFYETIPDKKTPKRETVQKNIAKTRKALACVMRTGSYITAKKTIEVSR